MDRAGRRQLPYPLRSLSHGAPKDSGRDCSEAREGRYRHNPDYYDARFLSFGEAAIRIGVSRTTIYSWRKTGELNAGNGLVGRAFDRYGAVQCRGAGDPLTTLLNGCGDMQRVSVNELIARHSLTTAMGAAGYARWESCSRCASNHRLVRINKLWLQPMHSCRLIEEGIAAVNE